MEDFKYRQENRDRQFPKFKEVTSWKCSYALLTLFLLESLARTNGTSEFERLNSKFIETLNEFDKFSSAAGLRNFYEILISKKTLVSRFNFIKNEFKNVLEIASNFMIFTLDHKNTENKRIREKISDASIIFNLYFEFQGRILPGDKSGTRLLGYFGTKDKKCPCIFYTNDMSTIDNSIGLSVDYPSKAYYYYHHETKELVNKSMTSSVVSNESCYLQNGSFHTSKENSMDQMITDCQFHTNAETVKLSCGVKHCKSCLLTKMEKEELTLCNCGYKISQKDLNNLKSIMNSEKSKEMLFSVKKTESTSNQVSGGIIKKPPPRLLPDKATDESQKKVNLFENDLKNKFDQNIVDNLNTVEIIIPEDEEILKTCSECQLYYFESEFYIKCDCINIICLNCRLKNTKNCFRCKKAYNEVFKLAIEIMNLTKLFTY